MNCAHLVFYVTISLDTTVMVFCSTGSFKVQVYDRQRITSLSTSVLVKMDVLEPSGDPEGGGSDDLTGRKKPGLKSLKSRLFGKIKRKDDDGSMKQTQSESDITLGAKNSQHEHSQGMLGSRALSHDSIFLAEDCHLDPEPPRGLSHENIHGKIQALQMKLQKQKMHLGPQPLLLPIKRHEHIGAGSEEDGLHRLSMSIPNKVSSRPLSPRPISPVSSPISPFAPSSGVDLSIPPQLSSLLDNSAARHRMSIKPKNQRASAKNKRTVTTAENRAQSESMNNLEHSLTDREEGLLAKESTHIRSYSSKVLRPGDKQTATQRKSTPPVSPLMSLQCHEESRQVSAESENERNLMSTSPQSPGLTEPIPAETPISTTRQEVTKESKCLPRSDEAQAAKPPSTVLSIDRKGKGDVYSFRLPRNSQSSLVSTLGTRVEATQKTSITQDERKYNDVVVQNKMDTSGKCSVQNAGNVENRHFSTQAPANVNSEVNLRPSSLRRNAPSTDKNCESKILLPVMTVSTVSQEEHKTESTKWQRPLSGSFHFTVSSDKIQERPRTASFTGVIGQARLRKEPLSPSKPPLTFNIKGQQAEKSKTDSSCNILPESQNVGRAPSHPVIPTKFTDPATNHSRSQDIEGNQDNGMHELGVEATEEEVQEGVEEAEEAGENVTDNTEEGKEKDSSNAFGVKLRSTSLSLKFRLDKAQSDIKINQHSSEVSTLSPPLALWSNLTSFVEREDHHTSIGLKPKDPPLQTNESFTSSCSLKGVCKDKERPALLTQAEPPPSSSVPSKATKKVPLLPKETADLPLKEPIAVSSQENATSTTSELSWMEMAREKTRSLQQLFTSRLPEFPGLQTTTRPTTLNTTQPQAQTSTSQVNARTTQNITSQQTQLQLWPTDTTARNMPSAQSSERSTQHMQTNRTMSQPSAIQTCTTTSQSQVDSTREVLFQSKPQNSHSTPKPTQSSVTSTSNTQPTTHTIHTAKPLQPQTPPIQQTSPLRVGPFQASHTFTQSIQCPTTFPAYPCLSSSPKITSNLMPQQSANTVSMHQLQNEGGESSTAAGKADRIVAQGKGAGIEDGKSMWSAGLGNKPPLMQRWENQSTSATKAGEQKDTPESQATAQSTAPLRPISKVSGTDKGIDLNASVSSVTMKTGDREDKCQKKPVLPSSSPSSPLQFVRNSGQPSWMELAKRKSLAWSDKTMD
ncbi:uncharacterized protein cracdla [Triplophysa rosa]|uniref:DUF4592 domain-containing protein n=1 Tax=Triplophysa rosa TaxID=992332 RepID=A0A9W7WUR7_TRIRA|nr:uncharacterized protein cracdla [Triplophysa rosa]KAI7808995.1 hypothetical protein IRJ41_024402 [Triplophysa rosa]